MMPILPFIEDAPESIAAIVNMSKVNGANFIIPSFGVALRDRQRAYFYQQLDLSFPGTSAKYRNQFGDRYGCSSPNHRQLYPLFKQLCDQQELGTKMSEVLNYEKLLQPMRLF